MKRLLLIPALVAMGCYSVDSNTAVVDTDGTPHAGPGVLGSFRVEVKSLRNSDGSVLPVVQSCAARYGGSLAQVPQEVRGTPDCRYAIPRGPLRAELSITALDGVNEPLSTFSGPVAFRVVPGALTGDYTTRWAQLTNGQGTGSVVASHVYSEVRVWVQDEPPQVDYVDGKVTGDTSKLPAEPPVRTYATGLSPSIYFEEPTVGRVQEPPTPDNNRLSPFERQFLTIGRAPETGEPLKQNCPDFPALPEGQFYPWQDPNGGRAPGTNFFTEDGKRVRDPGNEQFMTLVVTGTDPSGFFVTDLSACKTPEVTPTDTRFWLPEPTRVLPGTYGSLYIYNYSFPEDLYPGDLLWTLSGSVQEFTGTTQLTFPAWTVREHVRELPQSQWNKYLDLVKPAEVTGRLCGFTNEPNVSDALCGFNYNNMKMESLESALVKVPNVRFPQVFKNCNLNGDNEVPFFCPSGGSWTACPGEAAGAAAERQCNIDCTIGRGEFEGKVCSEKNSFTNFGQFVVELAGPGPRQAGLDDSLPARIQALSVGKEAVASGSFGVGTQLRIWCDAPVRVAFGPRGTQATAESMPLAANKRLDHTLAGTQQVVSFLADGENVTGTCQVAANTRTRINIVTRDAVPDLQVDCSEQDPDAEKARECRNLHGATFDVVGHLRQVTAARPRWMVMPRDADDLCCRPGVGLECPKLIKPCK
jgi:hypothetical protein